MAANPPSAIFRNKWFITLVSLVLAYTLIGFLLLPAIIKWQMRKQLPPLTKRTVAVRQVRVNPYALSLTIRDFALAEPNGDVFASFGEFHVNVQLWSSLFKRAFVFREIRLKKPFGNIVWLSNGTFNFSNLIVVAPAASSGKQELPRVVIALLHIEDGGLTFADLTRQHPFRQDYKPINLHLTNLSTLPKHDSPYSIVAITPAGGTFEWTGDASVNPPRSAGHFKLTGSALKTYSPYAQEFAGLAITDGLLAVQADYRFDYSTGQIELDVKNAGVQLDKLKVGSDDHATTISFDQLAVTGIEASVSSETLHVASVSLAGLSGDVRLVPTARAIIDNLGLAVNNVAADRRAGNFDVAEVKVIGGASGVIVNATTNKATTATATSSDSLFVAAAKAFHTLTTLIAKPLAVKINAVVFDKTGLRFTDESITPHAAAHVDEISGRVQGLTWDTNTLAQVEITGKVSGAAPFTLSGRLNPATALATLDLAFALKDNALMPGSPYMAKYAGYPVEQGTVSLDLRYHVTDRELKAENSLRVDQLRLGAASGSPDATKLPVKLAIALLQDRHGLIKLDVPVRGRLDDPQFNVGKLIFQVFMNILTKAVTKPFSLLASLIPGGGDLDLSYIGFVPGSADFAEGEVKKLDALATALYERPALSLAIAGSVDPVKDRQALAKLNLIRQVKERRITELPAKERATATAETFILDPVDYERLVQKLYAESMATGKAALPPPRAKLNFRAARQKASAEQPASAGTLTFVEMETKLIEAIPVSEEDFRSLLQNRANKVQAYLLQTGKVEQPRLSVAAPKAPAEKGQCRVELGLK